MRMLHKLFSLFFYLVIMGMLATVKGQDSAAKIHIQKPSHRVGVTYGITSFDTDGKKPWQLLSLEYTRHTNALPLMARVN